MDIMITVWDNGAHTCGTGSSAYSDMLMIAGNKVAILYEVGDQGLMRVLHIRSFHWMTLNNNDQGRVCKILPEFCMYIKD